MSEELKPCPICNSEAVDGNPMPSMSDRTPKTVKCSNYRCVLSRIHLSIESWNTRPIEDKLRKELEEVKFALQVEENDNEYNCAEKDRLKEENERLRALTIPRPMGEAPRDGTHFLGHWKRKYINACMSGFIEIYFHPIKGWETDANMYENPREDVSDSDFDYWIPLPQIEEK